MKKILTITLISIATLIASSSVSAHINTRLNQVRSYNASGNHFRICETDGDCCKKNPNLCEEEEAGSDYFYEVTLPQPQAANEALDKKENFCVLNKNINLDRGQLGQSVMKPHGKKLAKLLAMVANNTAAHGACDGEININEIPVCADSGSNDEVPACSAGCVLESLNMPLGINQCQNALHVRVNK